ncbi:aminoglycoside 6'-N-acetyltransferase [Acetobacter sp. JWB]|nr:GNAT family N-acetyltransferase [Acetobacter sp. JWB]KAA8422509.1 GNAT family N-acetyltransferase [Acetobacter pomorum]KAA8431233.1 GNAT family N-acetyltransferase [Acetobacter pomorum]KAA8448289.1 GNAT family N-acetyltransferase [Acetobacter pomorum]
MFQDGGFLLFRRATLADVPVYARLRRELWNDDTLADHEQQIIDLLQKPETQSLILLAFSTNAACCGFAEASMRYDYVNGCTSSPVAFLEGIYVVPAERQRGVARGLVEQITHWARQNGCTELASDAELTNTDSLAMHRALGFDETERVIFFSKGLI